MGFGETLQRLRAERKLFQSDVAKRGGLASKTVERLEKLEVFTGRPDTFAALAKGLGMTVEALTAETRAGLPVVSRDRMQLLLKVADALHVTSSELAVYWALSVEDVEKVKKGKYVPTDSQLMQMERGSNEFVGDLADVLPPRDLSDAEIVTDFVRKAGGAISGLLKQAVNAPNDQIARRLAKRAYVLNERLLAAVRAK